VPRRDADGSVHIRVTGETAGSAPEHGGGQAGEHGLAVQERGGAPPASPNIAEVNGSRGTNTMS
jgi:hypothetical protein